MRSVAVKRYWSTKSYLAQLTRVEARRGSGERSLHPREVVGSIPTAPAIDINILAFVSSCREHVSPRKSLETHGKWPSYKTEPLFGIGQQTQSYINAGRSREEIGHCLDGRKFAL
jgi:hypothetical protein